MLKYYLSYYWRSLQRQKVLAFINILGLAGGLAGSLILFLWAYNESQQDRFHANAEDIYLLLSRENKAKDFRTFSPFAKPRPELFESFSDIQHYSQTARIDDNILIEYQGRKVKTEGMAATSSFFKIFSFPLEKVDSVQLVGTKHIFLTPELANEVFQGQDPVGKSITLYHEKTDEMVVAGLVNNPPGNSSLQFEFIANYEGAQWGKMTNDFIKLEPGTQVSGINAVVKDLGRHSGYGNADFGEIKLFPLTDLYYESTFSYYPHGQKKYIYILSIVGIVILIIALFNYFNLTISQSLTRMKSIGVKRLMGMSNRNLWAQFSVESLINFLMAVMLVLLILFPLQYWLENLTGKNLGTRVSDILQSYYLLLPLLLFLVLGTITYFYFKSGSPLIFMKKQIQDHRRTITVKSNLVIFQFMIASFVVVATLVISRQTTFMMSQDQGYHQENIVKIPFIQNTYQDRKAKSKNAQYVKDQIDQYSGVMHSDYGEFLTDYSLFMWNLNPDSLDEAENVAMLESSMNFHNVFDLSIVQGSPFSGKKGVIINETAVDAYHLENPIGKSIESPSWGTFEIIGVVEDFHFENLSQPIRPLVFVNHPYPDKPIIIRIAAGRLNETMTYLQDLFEEINPGLALEYEFFDDKVEAMYRRDLVTTKILNMATIFVFLLSGIGLFSLSVVYTLQKTKEIGIRKVMGATVANILIFLGGKLTRWSMIGYLVALPVAFILLNQWLNDFAYRIELAWWHFAAGGAAIFFLTLLVVSYQTTRAALSNPVDSLRSE